MLLFVLSQSLVLLFMWKILGFIWRRILRPADINKDEQHDQSSTISAYEMLAGNTFINSNDAESLKILFENRRKSSRKNVDAAVVESPSDVDVKTKHKQKTGKHDARLKSLLSASDLNRRLLSHVNNLKINTALLDNLSARDLDNIGIPDILTRRFLREQLKLMRKGNTKTAVLTIETMLEQLNTLQDDLQSELYQLKANATHRTDCSLDAGRSPSSLPRLVARAALNKLHLNVWLLRQRLPPLLSSGKLGDLLRAQRPVWMFACGSAALLAMSVWRTWSQI